MKIRLSIDRLPEYHASGSDIYAAGSFNGWNPGDTAFRFNKDTKGNYSLDLLLEKGIYEYKLTRGDWSTAECQKNGQNISNRTLKVEQPASLSVTIEEWADRFPATPKKSTASLRVHIIDAAFLIPQLKRTRRVWIYLPEDHKHTSYPVLYMHDGQNVFDELTAYSGEWGIDEFMDSTTLRKSIVVAIDHGGAKRLNEYNPYDNERFGKGEGKYYAEFLVKTLKPYIDKTYKTLPDKQHTFIAGSSMGGLISLYTVLRYPTIFGGAAIFSPAFWISGPAIYKDIEKSGKKVKSNFYFFGGELEGPTMVPDMKKAHDLLAKNPGSRLKLVVKPDGKHNEPEWRAAFPATYQWLMNPINDKQTRTGE